MELTGQTPPFQPATRTRSKLKIALWAIGLTALTFGCMAFGAAVYLTHKFTGGSFRPLKTAGDMWRLADVSFARGNSSQWHGFANNIRKTKRAGRGGLAAAPPELAASLPHRPGWGELSAVA